MPWQQARYNPLRRFTARGLAIDAFGRNRYTQQPVDAYGLTREADELREAILAAFPDSPTRRNFAVDRVMVGGTALSDHARGEALDWMVPGYDKAPGISAADRDYGDRLVTWLDAQMVGPVGVGLRGKRFHGPFRISYWVWNGWQRRAGGVRCPLKPTSNQHRDHVHVSIVPVDRRTTSKPVTDPRRTLKRGDRGEDVKTVQAAVGTVTDGRFGPVTEAAVKVFQKLHGLGPTGIVDAATWAKIDEAGQS